MNIYLIPYTVMRHFVVALVLAAAGLMAWWWVQFVLVVGLPILYDLGIMWSQRGDGTLFLGTLVGVIAFSSIAAEGALRRRPLMSRGVWASVSAGLALGGTWFGNGLFALMLPLFTNDATDTLLADASFVSLRYHVFAWVNAGFWTGVGPFLARRMHSGVVRGAAWAGLDTEPPPQMGWSDWATSLFSHVGGGVAAGAIAAAVWHIPGHYPQLGGDLYLSSAAASAAFGGIHGLLCWGVPDDLYSGWVRVLSAERYGLRIPIPHRDEETGAPQAAERFVGHFPRGLDLYLPADRGVAELQASFVVDGDQRYTVRGLSVQPTVLRRTLERVDLQYDPGRPAPLETTLRMEDRVFLGEGGETVIEFLMLPREER